MTTLTQRFHALGNAGEPDDPPIQAGDRDDYLALKPHHYRPGYPATMTRVLVIREDTPSPADRFLNRRTTPRTVAVLVESLPTLSCRLRDAALGGRYGHLRPKPRSSLLMQELRCISRVIIDPRWRGLGLAVRLVRHALATAQTRCTEALAVMGRVSPFFERAGMTAYERPPLPVGERALAALGYAGLDANRLAVPATLERQIASLADPARMVLMNELTRWYRATGGRGMRRPPALPDLLDAARQRLLARPIYYLHENTNDRACDNRPE